jgi:hypothetical protein
MPEAAWTYLSGLAELTPGSVSIGTFSTRRKRPLGSETCELELQYCTSTALYKYIVARTDFPRSQHALNLNLAQAALKWGELAVAPAAAAACNAVLYASNSNAAQAVKAWDRTSMSPGSTYPELPELCKWLPTYPVSHPSLTPPLSNRLNYIYTGRVLDHTLCSLSPTAIATATPTQSAT